jgi:predicted permease
MKSLRRFLARITNFITRRRADDRLQEEIAGHIELQTEENIRRGMPPAEARRQALLKFGGVEAMKEEYRALRGLVFLETFLQDARYAWRMLRKSPSFSAVAVATLALGIGANAVVFGVLNGLIVHPLKLPQAQSLYGLERASDRMGFESYPNYLDLRARNRSFDDLAAFSIASAGIDTGSDATSSWALEVSGNYFDVLRAQPYLGGFFHSSDEHGPNSAPMIVLSYAFWHARFHDDTGVIGRAVRVNKHPYTVIGVAPPEFHGTIVFFFPDFFVPYVNQEQIDGESFLSARGSRRVVEVLGHLKPGVTPAQAIADLNSIGADLEKSFPKDDGKMSFVLARPSLYGDALGPPVKAFLAGLMMLAGLILLAACANLGSLFAARASDRSRELALRLALGSSRLRVLRQLFTEAILISLIGGAVGLWISVLLLDALSVWRPISRMPFSMPVNPDARVYLAALLLALASGFLFGAVPVRQVLRTDPYEIVKAGSSARAGRRITMRDLLLGAQIAICAVLVTSSMVAVRGLARTLRGNFGFEPRNALLVSVPLSSAGYTGDAATAMQKRVLDAVRAIPNVQSAGLIDRVPLCDGGIPSAVFTDDTSDLRPSNAAATPATYSISPEYFWAAGVALLAGRDFALTDDKNAPRVAIVNQEFARTIFRSASNATGKYFKREDGSRAQVIGVVEDGKYASLTEDRRAALYLPALQAPATDTSLIVRAAAMPGGDAAWKDESQQLTRQLRETVRGLDAGLPVGIQTWYEALNTVLFPARIATVSLGLFGVMGAMLSVTGIFGLAAYSVSKRRRELGIRIALGAHRKEVVLAALGRALKLLAFGTAAGLALGILASRVLALVVYEATPRDPLVLVAVVLAMALLGALATWIPAQRALAIDPAALMREE